MNKTDKELKSLTGVVDIFIETCNEIRTISDILQELHNKRKQAMNKTENPLADFIDERLIKDADSLINRTELYNIYSEYMGSNQKLNRCNFYKGVEEMGFSQSKRRKGRFFCGLRQKRVTPTIQSESKVKEWEEFSEKVKKHIQEYVIPGYGDYPDEMIGGFTAEDMATQIVRYAGRLKTNHKDIRKDALSDPLKIAHYACMLHTKMKVD